MRKGFLPSWIHPLWELYDIFSDEGPGPFYPCGGIGGGYRF